MQACIVAKIKKKKIDLCLGLDCRAVQAPLAMTELGLGLCGVYGLLKKLRLRLFWIATRIFNPLAMTGEWLTRSSKKHKIFRQTIWTGKGDS